MESTARKIIKVMSLSLIALSLGQTIALNSNSAKSALQPERRVILFIWDGLRPDSITEQNTPNLYRLKNEGTWFSDNHSSYPSFTMMNAASFATGNLAGKTGFYGNTLWNPRANGTDAEGHLEDFSIPVFTEDYKILQDLDRPQEHDPILFTTTLFSEAHKNNISTATIGKSGPAFMQNYEQEAGFNGIVLDEKHVYPLEFAKQLTNEGYSIPIDSPMAFKKGLLDLMFDNGNPTQFTKVATLKAISGGGLGIDDDFMFPDNVTPDPSMTRESPYSHANEYLMQTYLTKILPRKNPRLSVIWLRNPDTTEHNYGVGSPSYFTALRDQDRLLGKLLARLKELNLLANTDLIIASDHGHSNVSGPLNEFPLRYLHNNMVSVPDEQGYSTSGDFRPADLLTRAGFQAFDGGGCNYDPVLSGIKSDGSLVYPINADKTGELCGQVKMNASNGHRNQFMGHLYTTMAYRIPKRLPKDSIIVANNGGSTYFYVVNHDPKLIAKISRYLQSREEFGAIFVDDRYVDIPGVLPMSIIHIHNKEGRNPDIIASSNFDDQAVIRGMTGIEFNSGGISRGMHGSFSRTDIHNTLLAIGPDFKEKFTDVLPTANIDVAPTIAYLLHVDLHNIDGRPLLEALKNGPPLEAYSVLKMNYQPNKPAMGLTYQLATDPDGKEVDPSKSNYTINLHSKLLLTKNGSYQYFDSAIAKRY